MSVDANAWTSLTLVKEHLQITDTSKDTWLEHLINRSYVVLEKYTGRQMKARDYTEYYDGDNTNELLLRQWPIISVTSVNVDFSRVFDTPTLIDPAGYVLDAEWGGIRMFNNLSGFIVGGDTGQWPYFYTGVQNIKVVYRAGYETIPSDLEYCSTMHVAFGYNKAGAEGHLSLSLGGFSKAYMDKFPSELLIYLEPYKKRLSASR